MATIVERARKDGTKSYLAQIIRRKHGFAESRTFPTRKTAEAWAKMRERELDAQIGAGGVPTTRAEVTTTLGDLIDRFLADSAKPMGKTQRNCLKVIRTEYEVANKRLDQLTSKDLVEMTKEIGNRPTVRSKSTPLNYLAHLSKLFAVARPAYGYPLDKSVHDDALKACKALGYTGQSGKRDRRPTVGEINRLMVHFDTMQGNTIQMAKLVPFAIFSARRLDEICRITWTDYEPEHKRVMVRDMKHPGNKQGNDQFVDLPDPCCAIIDSMDKVDARIFPFNSASVSTAWAKACKMLEIENLKFHDLRHEGASRLFEMGWTIPQAASVTGHRAWATLQRYSHLRQTGDKWRDWEWIPKVTMKHAATG
ncbi:tyrosine-type recombinase/integrase [Cereibacter sphaeroides]|jgi:integrase|uniref:tyrosine-type recombinase/integrase n=1 Tax=Cereibacter sphaeroides TaxID=1063 RepID=UPI0000F29936|nr:phage integrase family protein [Cereibacter sphaeroides ATCC 17029]